MRVFIMVSLVTVLELAFAGCGGPPPTEEKLAATATAEARAEADKVAATATAEAKANADKAAKAFEERGKSVVKAFTASVPGTATTTGLRNW